MARRFSALHERSSRLLIAVRSNTKAAAWITRTIAKLLAPLPQPLRQTITFDNGTEFAHHYELHRLDIATFFCDPYAPWQKGGVENAIGRMRRAIPRKTDLATLTPHRLSDLVRAYNNTPRKCRDWHTPAELFCSQVLHFKCESTRSLSPERRSSRGGPGGIRSRFRASANCVAAGAIWRPGFNSLARYNGSANRSPMSQKPA